MTMIGVCGALRLLSSVFWNHSITPRLTVSLRASSALCASSTMIAPPKPSRCLPAPKPVIVPPAPAEYITPPASVRQ